MIGNRIKKNMARLKSWRKQHQHQCYRIYQKDIPEYPYIIDIYQRWAIVYEKGKVGIEDSIRQEKAAEIKSAINEHIGIDIENILVKARLNLDHKSSSGQYQRFNQKDHFFPVSEGNHRYWVNLHDYLDTGLFLDHRLFRTRILPQLRGKKLLNLFCYTGSISVVAAKMGMQTTNVDLSNTYLNWCEENFSLNKINLKGHKFVKQDASNFRPQEKGYDVIWLDPPSFSNSKSMSDTLDIQRDHKKLIEHYLPYLSADGSLYFSTNKEKFKIDESLLDKYGPDNLTEKSIDLDFQGSLPHQLYCFKS